MLKINPIYLQKEVQDYLIKAYNLNKEFPHLMLEEICTKESLREFQHKIKQLKFKQKKIITQSKYKTLISPNLILPLQELNPIIKKITGKIITTEIEVLQLSHKEYTLLHDKKEKEKGYTIMIDVTPMWDSSWGGTIIYKKENDYYTIPPKPNSLTIVNNQNMQSFIKYINHKAEKNKLYLLITSLK